MLKSNHRLTASAKALSDDRYFLKAFMMDTKELKIDWPYRLKKKMLFSLLGVLTVAIMVTMGHYCRDPAEHQCKRRTLCG